MKLAVVIAAYNEAENIGNLTSRLIASLDAIPDAEWELIYVIEGTDATRSIAQSFAATRPEIRIIYNAVASGLGKAFRMGFAAVPSNSDVVITMDADLNHQPEEISTLVRALSQRRADIVIGSRRAPESTTEGAPLWKTSLSRFVNAFIRTAARMPVADQTSGYRVYRYEALRKLSYRNSGFAFLPEILLQAHAMRLNIVEEPIHFIFRTTGQSKMKLVPTARSYGSMLISMLRSSQRH